MLSGEGPVLIEYNARFGDPEAINVLAVLDDNLLEIAKGIVEGSLRKAKFLNKATVVKYIAPQGYPQDPIKGIRIEVDEEGIKNEGAKIIYAAVDENLTLLGSRALAIVGVADSLEEAERIAENGVSYVKGPIFYRKDVGTRESVEKRIEIMKKLGKEFEPNLC